MTMSISILYSLVWSDVRTFGHHLGVRERQTEESGAEFSLESGDTVDVINCQQSLFVCEKEITLTWTSNLFGFTLDLVKS